MEKKTVTKEKVIGMQVIDSEGNLIGAIKDVSFTLGEGQVSIVIEAKDGKTQEISWKEVQAAGDFILLKPGPKIEAVTPTPTPTSTQNLCPTCGKPLTYIQQYNRWYCYNEKKYV